MKQVIVVIGSGLIGQSIARRVGVAKHIVLADVRQENAEAAARVLDNAGFDVSIETVETRHRAKPFIRSPRRQAGSERSRVSSTRPACRRHKLARDDSQSRFVRHGPRARRIRKRHGERRLGVVIASQSGHRLPALSIEANRALALTPREQLLELPFLQRDHISDSLHAYQVSKRGHSLRVMAEAVRWGRHGARVNTISPGIIITPLAKDERNGASWRWLPQYDRLCSGRTRRHP